MKYINIPFSILNDKELRPNAKLLYGIIEVLTHEKGFCWASNNSLAETLNITPQSISFLIKTLQEKNLIKINYIRENNQVKQRYIYITGVSINISEGINKSLRGYQQNFKGGINKSLKGILQEGIIQDNNTSIIYITKAYLNAYDYIKNECKGLSR